MGRKKQMISAEISLIAVSLICFVSCKSQKNRELSKSRNTDPGRCIVEDVGEATDFIQLPNIVDDRMVIAHGLANPQALVWRDTQTNRTFYLTRVMGTERRLYFMRQVADDEKPGVASSFKGHLVKWSNLPPKRSVPIANALDQQYNIQVKPEESYVIIVGEKPEGCP